MQGTLAKRTTSRLEPPGLTIKKQLALVMLERKVMHSPLDVIESHKNFVFEIIETQPVKRLGKLFQIVIVHYLYLNSGRIKVTRPYTFSALPVALWLLHVTRFPGLARIG